MSENDFNTTESIENETPPSNPRRMSYMRILTFLIGVIAIASISYCFFLNSRIMILSDELREVNAQLSQEISSVKELAITHKDLETVQNNLEKLKLEILPLKTLEREVALIRLGAEVSGWVVTEKTVIDKATFYAVDSKSLFGIIDIAPQPTHYSYFLAQGRFSLSDREVKVMLEELIDTLGTFSKISFDNLGVDFSKVELKITCKNYDVATYKDGVILLNGE